MAYYKSLKGSLIKTLMNLYNTDQFLPAMFEDPSGKCVIDYRKAFKREIFPYAVHDIKLTQDKKYLPTFTIFQGFYAISVFDRSEKGDPSRSLAIAERIPAIIINRPIMDNTGPNPQFDNCRFWWDGDIDEMENDDKIYRQDLTFYVRLYHTKLANDILRRDGEITGGS